jgi:dihydroxyacetone kinase-like protein
MACEKILLPDVKNLFMRLKETMLANKDHLIEIDGIMGDGDLGLTMVNAFSAASDGFPEESDLGKIFAKAGMAMAKAAPSTMGTLMGSGFMRGGKAVKEKTELGIAEMAQFWRALVEGMSERGKAKPGDKTIIDSLDPVAAALENAAALKKSLQAGFADAVAAAEKGMENTRTMEAQFGRLAYNQEKAKTLIDPGSVVGVLLVKTFADYFSE